MATRKELNELYYSIYFKNFPDSTLSKWTKEGKIKAVMENGFYNYDLESFKKLITSPEYKTKLKARKQNPKDYIGKKSGGLLIVNIVPTEERKEKNYLGTLMYCKCLKCNRKDLIQVRFSYLTNNNYIQKSCGCDKKQKAFLATTRKDMREEFLKLFNDDFEKFLCLHKILNNTTDGYYSKCSIEEYEKAITFLNNTQQFQKVYYFWKNKEKTNTFYDWAKPSIDHIIPRSKGGTNKVENLQILTVFENLSKRDMTWEEWQNFKKQTNTSSDYFIENILKL